MPPAPFLHRTLTALTTAALLLAACGPATVSGGLPPAAAAPPAAATRAPLPPLNAPADAFLSLTPYDDRALQAANAAPVLPVDLAGLRNTALLDGLTADQRQMMQALGFTVVPAQDGSFDAVRASAQWSHQPYLHTSDAALSAAVFETAALRKAVDSEWLAPRLGALLAGLQAEMRLARVQVEDSPLSADARLAALYAAVGARLLDAGAAVAADLEDEVERQITAWPQITLWPAEETALNCPPLPEDPARQPMARAVCWLSRAPLPESSAVAEFLSLALRKADLAPAWQNWEEVYGYLHGASGPAAPAVLAEKLPAAAYPALGALPPVARRGWTLLRPTLPLGTVLAPDALSAAAGLASPAQRESLPEDYRNQPALTPDPGQRLDFALLAAAQIRLNEKPVHLPPALRTAAWQTRELAGTAGLVLLLEQDLTVEPAAGGEEMDAVLQAPDEALPPPPVWVEPQPALYDALAQTLRGLIAGLSAHGSDPAPGSPLAAALAGVNTLAEQLDDLRSAVERQVLGQPFDADLQRALARCLGPAACRMSAAGDLPGLITLGSGGALGGLDRLLLALPGPDGLEAAQGALFSLYPAPAVPPTPQAVRDWRLTLALQNPPRPAWTAAFVPPGGRVEAVFLFRPGAVYTVTAGCQYINLRSEPSIYAEILRELHPGAQVLLTGWPAARGENTWNPVRVWGEELTGWMVLDENCYQ